MMNRMIYDITVIGGGPAGLFTAFYSGMRQAKVKVIESMPQLGGQLSALYPEKYIYDVAGFPKVRAQELIDNLKKQMEKFETTVVLEQSVEQLTKLEPENVFEIKTNKESHFSKTVIITAGAGAFQPRRLDLEGAEKYEGKNLYYFIDDLTIFQGKNVLVAGGGDSALDWSLMLEPVANHVTLTHRREKFRAHEHSVELLHQSNVDVKTPYTIKRLVGDGNRITKAILTHAKDQTDTEIKVDAVVVNYGFLSSLGPIKKWGLNIQKNSIVVNSKMETNIPGVYAAGDVATYPGKVKLIAVGFGEAPTAVNNAKAFIDPKARLQPGHSSSMF